MDRHSRIVALLKVLLPLAALTLLSTVFLISRSDTPEATIPFARQEIEERMRGQQITAPFFAGTTAAGDEILVTADRVTPGRQDNPTNATKLEAILKLSQGGRMTMTSETGNFLPDQGEAHFTGMVTITTADGLVVETEELRTQLHDINATAPKDIRANGPFGTLSAGAMQIDSLSPQDTVYIVFKNGVKLVYDPSKPER